MIEKIDIIISGINKEELENIQKIIFADGHNGDIKMQVEIDEPYLHSKLINVPVNKVGDMLQSISKVINLSHVYILRD